MGAERACMASRSVLPAALASLLVAALFAVLGLALIVTEPALGPAPALLARFELPPSELLLRLISLTAGLLLALVAFGWFATAHLLLAGRGAARRATVIMAVGTLLLIAPTLMAGRFVVLVLLLPLPLLLGATLTGSGEVGGWRRAAVFAGGMAALLAALSVAG